MKKALTTTSYKIYAVIGTINENTNTTNNNNNNNKVIWRAKNQIGSYPHKSYK